MFTVCWLLAVVAGAGAGLVSASPPRPAQPVGAVGDGDDDERGEQVLELVAGQRDEAQGWWVAGVLGGCGHHQERGRQQGQGHPAVPGAPAAGPGADPGRTAPCRPASASSTRQQVPATWTKATSGRSPSRPAPQPPGRGPASPWPAWAWSPTRPGRGRRRPGSARRQPATPGAGTAHGRSPCARPWGHRPGRPRLGRCRPCRRCRCIDAAPHRGGALLEVPGLIDHQHRARVAEVLDHQGAHVVADPVVVPDRPGQQVLHAVRVAWPACSAIVQQFLPGRSASSPSTNALARRLGSTLGNRPATRPITSSNNSCHRAGSTSRLWPAATV
jgi:hypothetical protein